MVAYKGFNQFMLVLSWLAILLIIAAPQINRLKTEARHSQVIEHNQSISPAELAQIAIEKVKQQKSQKISHHEHKYLCEYCVLAAHMVSAICLILCLFAVFVFYNRCYFYNFFSISSCFYKSHPPRAGPRFISIN